MGAIGATAAIGAIAAIIGTIGAIVAIGIIRATVPTDGTTERESRNQLKSEDTDREVVGGVPVAEVGSRRTTLKAMEGAHVAANVVIEPGSLRNGVHRAANSLLIQWKVAQSR